MRHGGVRLVMALTVMVGFAQENQPAKIDVLTNRYDVSRTGANLRETVLMVQNVCHERFGKIFEREVDGDIYAQPLIKTNVTIPKVGVRDVVYVATVNNSLYAFDADSPGQAQPYWHATSERAGPARAH